MNRSPLGLAYLVAAWAGLTLGPRALAQSASAATDPAGYVQTTLAPSADGTNRAYTPAGFPLHAAPVYTGAVASVSGNTITLSGTSFPSLAAPPYLLHVRSAANEAAVGASYLVISSTGGAVTVSSSNVALQTILSAGDSVAIRPADTLGSIFGSTDGTVLLQGGQSAGGADVVYIWNGTYYDSYYYYPGVSWVMDGDSSFASQNNCVIYPGQGVLVGRISMNVLPAAYAASQGIVPANEQKEMVNTPGLTLVANPFPMPISLAQFGFLNSPSWLSGQSAGGSDTVYEWQGTGWQTYYNYSGYGWVLDGDASFTIQDNTQIPAGTAVLIMRQNPVAAPGNYIDTPLNYSLN